MLIKDLIEEFLSTPVTVEEARRYEYLPSAMLNRVRDALPDDWKFEGGRGLEDGTEKASAIHIHLTKKVENRRVEIKSVFSQAHVKNEPGTIELTVNGKTVESKRFKHWDFDSFLTAIQTLSRVKDEKLV